MPKGEHGGEIFSHVHRAIDELSPKEDSVPGSLAKIEWYSPETQQKVSINLAALFSNANLSENDMKLCERLMVRYVVRGNRVGIMAVALALLGSLGTEGRHRKDILEAIGGSTKKIMETIQTQRTRKITAGKEAELDENPGEGE